MLLVTTLLTWTVAASDAESLPLGTTVRAEVTDGASLVHTDSIHEHYGEVRGRAYAVRVEEDGTYRFELVSHLFDAYLVLREEGDGALLEDDDSLGATHARIVAELKAGRRYEVAACALHGDRGPFELTLLAGAPPSLSPVERMERDLTWARDRHRDTRDRFGADAGEMRGAWLDLGRSLQDLGYLQEAYDAYREGVALCERIEDDSPYEPTLRTNLAHVLRSQGRYDDAIALARRALEQYIERRGEDSDFVTATATSTGVFLMEAGRPEEAIPMLERALAGLERRDAAAGYAAFRVQQALSTAKRDLGRFAEARVHAETAVRHLEEITGPRRADAWERALTMLGNLNLQLGYTREGLSQLERAVEISPPDANPDAAARTRHNLARARFDSGDPQAALDTALDALRCLELAGVDGGPAAVRMLTSLALYQRELGDREAACTSLERALGAIERAGLEGGTDAVATRVALAEALIELDRCDEAAARLQEAEGLLPQLDPQNPLAPLIPWLQMQTAIALGRDEEALSRIPVATERSEALLARTQWGLTEAERFRHLASHDAVFGAALGVAIAQRSDVEIGRLWDAAIRRKARVSRVMRSTIARAERSAGGDASATLAELRAVLAQLSGQLLVESPVDREAWRARLVVLQRRRNQLEADLRRTIEGDAAETISRNAVVGALPRGAALVDFLVLSALRVGEPDPRGRRKIHGYPPDKVFAWIARPDGRCVFLSLGDAESLKQKVHAFLSSLQRPRGHAALDVASDADDPDATSPENDALRDALWRRVRDRLGDADTVIVSPDRFLAGVPFEAIQDEDGAYLIQQRNFVYLDDPALLLRDPTPRSRSPSLALVGAVDFRSAPSDESDAGDRSDRGGFPRRWPPLPGTRAEVTAIADLHAEQFGDDADQLLLLERAPSEARLKDVLGGYDVLHLATHGFFQPEGVASMWERVRDERGRARLRIDETADDVTGLHPGLLSGLVCAGVHAEGLRGDDDGYLTAEEVAWLDLREVELVTLSACDTGLGREQSGEGLMGLRRAFQNAGADTVVSSLWPVSDQATAELMPAFYGYLWLDGLERGEALRRAKLDMLESNLMQHGDALPATWAAFVLSGEWR